MPTTVGGTLGAPGNDEMIALACHDGDLEVPSSVIALALGRHHIHEEVVGTIGGGGVAGVKTYRFGGSRKTFAEIYGLTVPDNGGKPALQPPPANPPPTAPQTPQIPAGGQPWRECPYMGGFVSYEGKVLARMINDVARHLGVIWR